MTRIPIAAEAVAVTRELQHADAVVAARPLPSAAERVALKRRIAEELQARHAVLVAHFYVDGDLQDLAPGDRRLCLRFARDGPLRA